MVKSKKMMPIFLKLAICLTAIGLATTNGIQAPVTANAQVGMTGMITTAKSSHATYVIINNKVVKTNKVYPKGGKYIVQTSPRVGYVTIKDAIIPNKFYLLATTSVQSDLGYR